MFKTIENGQVRLKPLLTIFNGQTLEEALTNQHGTFKTIDIEGRGLVEVDVLATDVPGRDGSYYRGTRLKPRSIKVKALLTGQSALDLRKQFTSLNRLLDVGLGELSFSDEPGYFYRACFVSSNEPPERKDEVVLEMNFICTDPKKYSEEQTVTGNGVQYQGVFETNPVITVTLSAGGSELRLLHVQQQKYVRIKQSLLAGNRVEFDMGRRSVKVNGRSVLENFDMVNSRFFPLVPGANTLSTNLAGSIQIKYREVST
ncbi:phage tail family protein [Streptococcus suis]|nr:phage tail family protein [Streptococcus suis]